MVESENNMLSEILEEYHVATNFIHRIINKIVYILL